MEFINIVAKLASLPQDANDYMVNLNFFASDVNAPMLLRPMTDASKEEVEQALHMSGHKRLKVKHSDLFTAIWYPETRKKRETMEVEFVLDHLRMIKRNQLNNLDIVKIDKNTILNGVTQHIYQNYAYFKQFPHYTLADIQHFQTEEDTQIDFINFQWNVNMVQITLPPSLVNMNYDTAAAAKDGGILHASRLVGLSEM
tara:strand:- start:1933 stop:2529 length:597 start_codon:yes stop_codon:yes gene_type:complete